MIAFPFDPPTGWAPSAYVSETAPPVRDTPDAWIAEQATGGVYLAGPDEDMGVISRPFVASAQVTTFSAYFALGFIEIAVAADGSWTSEQPVPAAASNFTVAGELDFHVVRLDDLAHNWAATQGGTGDETLTIECWHWVEDLRFILGRQPNQPFTFIPVQTVGRRVSEVADR